MIYNCLIEDNLGGINCSDHGNLLITNCTIVHNYYGGGIYCYWSNPTIINSILWANSATHYGPQITLRTTGWPSILTVSFSNIEGGQAEAYVESGCTLNWGPGNIDADPYFADPCNGDYHLKSQAGRWDANSQSWVKDSNMSPCIDAGDPNSDWRAELWPHGRRINMGAYGGTPQASMSLSTFCSIADLDNDGDLDFNDVKLFTEKWLAQQVLLAADLDRNGDVNFVDFAIFGNEWLKENAPLGMTYQIGGCGTGMSAVKALDATRFTVTVNGSYIHFEDTMVANCCPDKLELAMEVYDNQIIIYEREFLTYFCYCICDYPVTADLGPFKSGTYTFDVYEDYGGFIGSTTVTIE
jgi:hypothetical protein